MAGSGADAGRAWPVKWRVCRWGKIQRLRFFYSWPPQSRVPDADVPPGSKGCLMTHMEVRLRGGRQVDFTDATSRHATGLAVMLREEAARPRTPWDAYPPLPSAAATTPRRLGPEQGVRS